MRAVRFLTFALLLTVGLAGVASAQAYSNTPGVYPNVNVGVVPAMLPPGSLPGDIPTLGPDLYNGTLTIVHNLDGTYSASFDGETADRAKLHVTALFSSAWVGVKIGTLIVGTSTEENVIKGIDGMHLLSASINGVGSVDQTDDSLVNPEFQRIIAKFSGDGVTYPPSLTMFKVLKAPGYLR